MTLDHLIAAAAEWGIRPTDNATRWTRDVAGDHGLVPMTREVYSRVVKRALTRLSAETGEIVEATRLVREAGFGEPGELGISPTKWAAALHGPFRIWASTAPFRYLVRWIDDYDHATGVLIRGSMSPYDPDLRSAMVAWASGLSPAQASTLPGFPTGRRGTRAMARIGEKLKGRSGDQFPILAPGLGLGELVRLGRLGGAFLRAVVGAQSYGERLTLAACEAHLPAWRTMHADGTRAALQRMRIPASHWLVWRLPDDVGQWAEPLIRHWPLAARLALLELGRRGVSLIEGGILKAPPCEGLPDLAGQSWSAHLGAVILPINHLGVACRTAMVVAAGQLVEPTQAQAASSAQLLELLDAAGHSPDSSTPEAAPDAESGRRARSGAARSLDRLAQREPEWAIRGWRWEYERAARLADLIGAALRGVIRLLDEGAHVLIHGRDGEILWDLLRRSPGWRCWRGRVVYVLTSRPLTTQGRLKPEYMAYARRIAPPETAWVHVDTGHAGSIPAWFIGQGWTCDQVQLISATSPESQLAETAGCDWDVVLGDIEHSQHRLEKPQRWGEVTYSSGAPGYWARLYGLADALGLPRQVSR